MAISRAFQRETQIHPMLTSVTLDNNDEASSDICQYIEDSFLDILDTHPLQTHIPSNWPEPYYIDQLVQKLSGHFIYAATAMKFISSTDEHPARALQVVKGLVPSRMGNPFADLDALYLHILTSAKYSNQVLAILRHCILTYVDNSVQAVCFMYPNISPEDVVLFLSDIHALVSLAPDNAGEMWITLKHASLGDFLKDVNRSHGTYMDGGEYKASLLPRYFQLFDISCDLMTSLFFFRNGTFPLFCLMHDVTEAITHSQDLELLQSLICGQSSQNVWTFLRECELNSDSIYPGAAIEEVSNYVCAIRDSAANYNNALYNQQFKLYIEVLMDHLNDLVQSQPQYQIIPTLIFASSPRCLAVTIPLLIRSLPQLIDSSYLFVFGRLRPATSNRVIDSRSYEAIRSLPQTRLSWSSGLATTLNLVLRQLMGHSWMPECLYPNPHQRWLRRMKPLKHKSLGSHKLLSTFYSYLRRLPTPQITQYDVTIALERHGYSISRAKEIDRRREQFFALLKTVIAYLHKCDCTSELAKLARNSLPKSALWFPKLMRRARVKMDAYVRRWEESPDGLFEKPQLGYQ